MRIQRSFQRGKAQTPDLQPPTAGELDEKSLRLNNGETPDAAADAAEWPVAQTFSPHEAPPIFGHDIFRSQMLSFEPHANVAVREDYVLGPGDELHVEVYGTSQYSSKQLISPEGDITLKYIGPILSRTHGDIGFSIVYSIFDCPNLILNAFDGRYSR